MPLNLLKNLELALEKALNFRKALADSPVHLDRAETALKTFERARDELLKEAPNFHEEKGVLAGLKLAGPIILRIQEQTKKMLADGKIEPEVGKAVVRAFSSAADELLKEVDVRTEVIQRKAGKLDGIHWAAKDALVQIADTCRHYAAAKAMEDDEDWSGRATARKAEDGGNGKSAKVLDLAASRGKDRAEKSGRRRGTTKRAPRKKTSEPEAPKEN
jgi:hypothetical protein